MIGVTLTVAWLLLRDRQVCVLADTAKVVTFVLLSSLTQHTDQQENVFQESGLFFFYLLFLAKQVWIACVTVRHINV